MSRESLVGAKYSFLVGKRGDEWMEATNGGELGF